MSALRNRDLVLLLVTWGVWVTTDWALLVTVSLVALDLDGPTAVGLVGAVRVLPAAVLTSPLSVLTDRWSRARLLAVVYAGWALLAGCWRGWCRPTRRSGCCSWSSAWGPRWPPSSARRCRRWCRRWSARRLS